VNGCTATLIHHRVVTTAAHCMQGSTGKVTFTAGKDASGATIPGSFSLTGKCTAGARGSSGGGTKNDWAYCVIPEDERVNKFQITPPLVGCEADKFLKPGAEAWIVGFGTTGSDGNGYGVKREVAVKVNKVGNGILDVGDRDNGPCHGDSGGPIYMRLTDGTHDWGWRVFGSTSSASGNCDCTCSSIYVNISQHVAAIEKNEMIDVTPCTDDSGAWAPGPDCKEFQSTPQDATGTYPMCSVATTKDPIESCGASMTLPGAGSGAAGTSAAAGSGGAVAAAGAAGAAGAHATAGASGAPVSSGTAGAAAIGGGAGSSAAGSFGVPVVATAGRGTAGVAAGTAGIGSMINGVNAAGRGAAGATALGPTQPAIAAPPAKSSGCQVANPGASTTSPVALAGLALGFIFGRRRKRA
jgi:MYXO-CTERM domain-containing protein